MKTTHRLALFTLSLASFGPLLAQTTTDTTDDRPRRGPHGHGRGHPIIRALDTDKNHEISATELANASVAIRTLDANSDGAVAADELRPARPADAPERPARPADAPERPRPTDPVMLALDADADRSLSIAEIANASASLAALDANKDGKLTRDELRPLPPEGAPAEGDRRGPGGPRGPRGPRR